MFARFLPSLRRRPEEPEAVRKPKDVFELMDEMLQAPFGQAGALSRGFPSMDVKETDDDVVVSAELPGLAPEDVELYVEAGRLVLRGEKRRESEEKDEDFDRLERSYGSFYRAVDLPAPVDQAKAKASFKNGVLTVRLPKDEAAKPRKVAIE